MRWIVTWTLLTLPLGPLTASRKKMPEALRIFGLNAASYPESPAAQLQLGEAYRYRGQTEAAIAQYRKVLALDPEDPLAASRLHQLGAAD